MFYQLREFLAHVQRVSSRVARICWERCGKTGTPGGITEVVPKEGEVIKNETVRLTDADSIARLPGKPPVRSHSTVHSSFKKILLKCVCMLCRVLMFPSVHAKRDYHRSVFWKTCVFQRKLS